MHQGWAADWGGKRTGLKFYPSFLTHSLASELSWTWIVNFVLCARSGDFYTTTCKIMRPLQNIFLSHDFIYMKRFNHISYFLTFNSFGF